MKNNFREKNIETRPVSKLAKPNGLVDRFHGNEMDVEEVKHLVEMLEIVLEQNLNLNL